jgi:hypothetical protein
LVAIVVAAPVTVGCTTTEGNHTERPDASTDSGSDANTGNAEGAKGEAGPRCAKDIDCETGLVCEIDRCVTPSSVTYPTTPPPPLSATYPTTCFVSDVGVLEIRVAPPSGRMSFGAEVLLGDNRLVVGASFGAQTYRGTGLTWTEEGFVQLPTESLSLMALDGDMLAVGSPYVGQRLAGAVYVYTLGTDGGAVAQVVVPQVVEDYLQFGSSVALSGQDMAVATAKSVVVLSLGAGGWIATQEIVPNAPMRPASISVGLHGDVLVVGMYWYPSTSSTTENGMLEIYRRAVPTFVLEQRIDLGALPSFFTYPVVGDGFFAMASDRTNIYAKGATNWAIEARLGTGPATPVIDGSRLAMGVGSDGIGLFERQNGTWPMTMTVKAHDVSATPNIGSPLALHGDVLAVGDQLNIGNGPNAGAAYTFTKTTSSSAPDCSLSAIGPPRIEGAGTGCVEPGTGMAMCPYIAPGTSTVAGTTPYGAVSFPFAWADVVSGEGSSTTIEVSDVAPRRTGTSPMLGFRLGVAGDPPTAQPIPATFSLTLCSRTVTVDGQVTFDAIDEEGSSLAGSITIDHDGWNVRGRFEPVICLRGAQH